ncbi:hypothetical protein HY256_00010 [Candidatus Sumerlaeota bacterium]|nr:hypothetical protein [Candidatus Sumerlaeota bacterium]
MHDMPQITGVAAVVQPPSAVQFLAAAPVIIRRGVPPALTERLEKRQDRVRLSAPLQTMKQQHGWLGGFPGDGIEVKKIIVGRFQLCFNEVDPRSFAHQRTPSRLQMRVTQPARRRKWPISQPIHDRLTAFVIGFKIVRQNNLSRRLTHLRFLHSAVSGRPV